MELRSQKTRYYTFLILSLVAMASPALAADLRYEVLHDHLWKSGTGTLVVSDEGISYQEAPKEPKGNQPKGNKEDKDLHHGTWAYEDIQQLYLTPKKITIRTYKDRKWRLGADEQKEFTLNGEDTFHDAYEFLKTRLDQRFVAAFADDQSPMLWEIPVKLKGLISGSEGVLQFGPDRIVYKTRTREQSRTWRYSDIENVSSSGPFQLTITTFEKSMRDYGDLRALNFQLKRPLDEKRYNLLWRRLNQTKGLELITSIQNSEESQQ